MESWKSYLQPSATTLVAISLGLIGFDQYRTSNARFNCAHVFSTSVDKRPAEMTKNLDLLGLQKDGNYHNIIGYCRAFLYPEKTSVSSSDSFPSSVSVSITDMPSLSGSVDIGTPFNPIEVEIPKTISTNDRYLR